MSVYTSVQMIKDNIYSQIDYHCYSSGYKWRVEGYKGIVLEKWDELVLQKGGDIERRGNSVRVLRKGGSIICYDKEVVWGVAMSDDVLWLYW